MKDTIWMKYLRLLTLVVLAFSFLEANAQYNGTLTITNPVDVTSTNGALIIGHGSSSKLLLDDNEIQSTTTLHINNDNNVDLVLNSGGGKVGVGTSSPIAKLDVLGSFRVATNGTFSGPDLHFRFYSGDTKESATREYLSGDRRNIELRNGWGSWRMVAAGDFNIVNWNGQYYDAFFIKATNGNVGIGTTAPDSKLTVKGVIHAEEVKVDLNVPGPDYVFDESYSLRSLEDTKAYIDQNKHLPGIPSSDEMQLNGVNLLEMNMKLLEKVEELTLHLIEQERKLMQQQKEIEVLKTNITKD